MSRWVWLDSLNLSREYDGSMVFLPTSGTTGTIDLRSVRNGERHWSYSVPPSCPYKPKPKLIISDRTLSQILVYVERN